MSNVNWSLAVQPRWQHLIDISWYIHQLDINTIDWYHYCIHSITIKTKKVKIEDKDKRKDTTNTKCTVVGKIKELETHLCVAGGKQQHHYAKITEAITDYVGGLYGMDMIILVKKSKDSPPLEPEKPSKEEANNLIKWTNLKNCLINV